MSEDADSPTSPMDYVQWARVYDIFYEAGPELEVEFYLELMRECDGPVLELGVGTGRVAIPAALEGHHIVGIDLHAPMLDVAKAKAAKVGPSRGSLELIHGDMTELRLPYREFGLVIIPGNSLGLVLTEQAQLATMAAAEAYLKPGGVLAFSMYNAVAEMIECNDSEHFLLGVVDDARDQQRYILSGINHFDTERQINDCTQIMETVSDDGDVLQRQELRVVTRYLTRAQAANMAVKAGLQVDHIYGGFDRSEYTDSSDEMILVCRKTS